MFNTKLLMSRHAAERVPAINEHEEPGETFMNEVTKQSVHSLKGVWNRQVVHQQ